MMHRPKFSKNLQKLSYVITSFKAAVGAHNLGTSEEQARALRCIAPNAQQLKPVTNIRTHQHTHTHTHTHTRTHTHTHTPTHAHAHTRLIFP